MMRKTSLALRWTKSIASQNERNSRAERIRARALRLESLESRELLSVAPGGEPTAINAAYESNVAIPDDVLDLSAALLDDVAPDAPEWITVDAPAPVAATPTPLETPTLTVGAKTETSITVSWNTIAHADRYSLSYKPSSETAWTNVNVGTNASYTITGLENNTQYDLRLKAIGDGVNYKSVYSPVIQETTGASSAPSGPIALETPVLTVTDKTETSIAVSWNAVEHADRYSLSYKTANATTWTNVNVGTSASYTITGLVNNTQYDIRLKAVGDGVNYKSVYSSIIKETTGASSAPTGPISLVQPVLTVTGKTGVTISVKWNAVAHAERYSVGYKLASETEWTNVSAGTSTSYTITGLELNTKYDLRVKAIGDGVNYKSVYSPIVQETTTPTPPPSEPTPLDPPAPVVTGKTGKTITVAWDAVENALRYSVSYKRKTETVWKTVNVGTNTSYKISELLKNKQYDIRVKATGDEVYYKSSYSPIVTGVTDATITPLDPPVLNIEPTSSTITVSWDAVPHAEKYSVGYKLASDSDWTNKSVGTNTSYTINGLQANTEYDVRVKAVAATDDPDYKSFFSATYPVKTNQTIQPLAQPVLAVETAVTIATVSWDAVENAQRYDLSYKPKSATTWTTVDAGSVESYEIKNLVANTEYDVRVKAVGDDVIYQSVDSEIVRFKTASASIVLATPILTYSATPSSLTVSWDAVAHADRYSLSYRLKDTTTWTNVNVGENTSHTINELTRGAYYELRVKAIGDGVNYKSVYSATVTAQTNPNLIPLPTPVLNVVGVVGPTFLTINWDEIPNALRYSLSYKLASETDWTNTTNVGTNTSYKIEGLTRGTEYDVQLKAIGDGDYKSVYSPVLRVETSENLIPLDSPRATVEVAPTSLTVSWDAVPNAARYGVSYKLAGASNWTHVNVKKNLSCTIEGLDPTTEYEVRVKAVGDGVTYESSYSILFHVETPAPDWPIITTVDVSDDSILLHWNPVLNAVGYYVEYAPVGSTIFTQKYAEAPTAYARITGLSANTEYQLKIRVATYEETSEFSPIITRTTSSEPFVKTALAKPTISARGIASDALYVEWDADPRATGYIVSYKEKGSEGAYATINVPASETGLVLSGLAADTNYYVRVKTVGDNVFWSSSTYSTTQTVKTKDASFLSTAEYEELRLRYDQLLIPESIADVNIVLLDEWTADAIIDAIEEARSTPVADVILLDPEYFDEILDLSSVSITLNVDYETSGAISILSRGLDPDLDRAQIKVNDSEVSFNAIAGLTQFGGLDFVDVNPDVSVYQVTAAPTLEAYPTAVDMQGVGMYTPEGISIAVSKNAARTTPPVPSENPSEDDYALLFIGGSNPRVNFKRYYETLRDYYYELVEDFALDPANIYILYADGDVSGTSYNKNDNSAYNGKITTSDMSFVLPDTTVRAATGAELTSTFYEIATREDWTADSHLLFWTYDHGDGAPVLGGYGGYYSDATADSDDYLCGWGENIDPTTVRDALFQISQGYATCVFTQCFSGGVLDDIFVKSGSTWTVSDEYQGSAHFAGGAATNHYEVSYTGELIGPVYFGYAQTFGEALRYRSTGVDAFVYTERNEYYSVLNQTRGGSIENYASNEGAAVANAEHPWHVGETFPVFTTSPERSAPTITSHSSTTDAITLTWSAVPNASSYTLEYSVNGGVISETVENIQTNSYTVTGLAPARFYSIKVKADNSPYSPQTSVLTESGGVEEPRSTVVTTVDDPTDKSSRYDGKISLRDALEYAQPGDTITFDPSLLGKTIKLSKTLNVTKSVTIDASNLYDANTQTPGVTISGEGAKRVMSIDSSSSLTVKGVEFTRGQSAGNTGAAIRNQGDLTVENCVFSHNKGVAISLTGPSGGEVSASLTARSTVFSDNDGSGAVFFNTNKNSSLTDCVFKDNKATKGAIYDNYGSVTTTNCIVQGNEGSGFYVETAGNLTAINCLVAGNTAAKGAGIDLSGNAALYYCTIAGNAANSKGGGINIGSDAVLNAYNAIISGNTAASEGDDCYCEVLNGGTGSAHGYNVLSSFVGWETEDGENPQYFYDSSQPLFNDAANDDYTLAENSQAINKGNAGYVPDGATVTTDRLGRNRVSGGAPDLGAYEYHITNAEPLSAPTIVSATATTDSITATWNPVANASGYKVEYKTAGAAEWTSWSHSISRSDAPAATSETITGLTPGTRYYARVTALSGEQLNYVDSAPSQSVSAWTLQPLESPTVTATTDVNQATVSWTVVSNASGYAFSYKKTSDPDVEASWTVVGVSSSTTSYTVESLDGATEYDFKLVAKGNGTRYADSDPSLVVAAIVKKKLDPPTISVTPGVNSVEVNWTAVDAASGYRVSYRKSGESSWTLLNFLESKTSCTIGDLAGATNYDFRVVAKGDSVWRVTSDSSAVVRKLVLEKLDSPTIANTTSDLNSISVSWNAVKNAVGYKVRYAFGTTYDWSDWELVGNATNWSARVDLPSTVLSQGTSYAVQVVAIATDGYVNSDAAKTTVETKPLAAPTISDKSANANSISISWIPVEYAAEYRVQYREEGAGAWSAFENTTGTSWTKREGIQNNKVYEVRLLAIAGDYRSAYSKSETIDTSVQSQQQLSAPTITVTPDANKATVSWGAVQNASGYALYYKKRNVSNWTEVSNIESPSYTVDDLDGATRYDFKVVAKGDGVSYADSDPSAVKTATIKAKLSPAPTLSVTPSVKRATASWTAVPNASGYTLYYKKSSASDWSKMSDIAASETSVTVAGLAGATDYDFYLVANGDGTSYVDSDESAVVTKRVKVKLSPTPTLSVTPGVSRATVDWDAVPNASGYTLSIKKSSESTWTNTDISASSTSYTVTGLDGATEYDFKLVAKGDGTTYANSDGSPVATVVIKAKLSPAPTITVTPNVNSAKVAWTAVPNASSYALYYKKSSASSWTEESGISASSTSYTVADLDGATNYDFKLVAKGDGTRYVDSGSSAVVTKTSLARLAAPTISVAPDVYRATVSWNRVDHASSYTVYWRKSNDPDAVWVSQNNVSSSASNYTVTNLDGAAEYDFKVVANSDGTTYVDSNASSVVSKIVKAQFQSPTGLTVVGHTDKTISVKWNLVANATSYTLQCVGDGKILTRGVSDATYTFTDLKPATQYTITVKANGDDVYYVGSNYSGAINPAPKTKETASVVVNSTADMVDAYDGVITLREALTVYRAQGTTVTFDSSMAGKTIALNSQIALSASATIDASALSSPVTVSGQQKTRVLSLSGTNQTFTINKVNFTQGRITSGAGGAINLTGSGAKLVVNDCAFTNNVDAGPANSGDNFANQGGGAVYVGSGAQIDATNCSFTSNTTTQSEGRRGGAVHLYGGVGNFTACTIQGNKSFYGGGVYYAAGATGTMSNCLVVKNDAGQFGGGVAIDENAVVTFTNCTIVKNTAAQSGGGVYVLNGSSKATFRNCIVVLNSGVSQSGHNNIGWNNAKVSAPNVYGYKTLSRYVTWKNSGGNFEFDGVDANLFVNPNSDWTIKSGSQAHNKGNNSYSPGSTDLAGNQRIRGGTIDLGCYELQTGSSALLDDDAELFEEIEDSLDLIAASLLELE